MSERQCSGLMRGYNLLVFRRPDFLVPHLPAALLLLFSGWSGTFYVGAQGAWALTGHLALVAFAGAFGSIWPDPLRFGRGGRLLLVALATSVLASHLASPVTRAGRLGVILLPAFVLVPSAVARCWSRKRARGQGLRSVSLVVIVVACWSLVEWWRLDTPGTSLPLGHHNLQAAWLVALLPLAVVPWREAGAGRLIAVLAGIAGLASLLAGRSLAAAFAAGALALAFAVRGRGAWIGLVFGMPLLATQLPRIGGILSGSDVSVAARWSYLLAGWRAVLERPVLGWGPGAARWTINEHLRPIPGVHPPDQVVADVHSLPLMIGYELGLSGLLLILGLALVFLWRKPVKTVDPALRRAAHLGLGALAIMSCVGRPLAAAALPLAAMIGVGAILASEVPPARHHRRREMATVVVAAVIVALALPLDLAHMAYDRAVLAESSDRQAHHLRRAVELDPAFPLYRARLAWLEAGKPGARAAAESARAVAPLWLVAGMLAQENGETWSREALLRACRLSPLGVIAPYRLTFEQGSQVDRVQWTARALLAEPLLLAAVAWRDRAPELRAAVDEIGRLGGIDAGWHAWLEQALAARQGGGGPVRQLALSMDTDAATSVSLYAFRRRPWPVDLARIEIYQSMLATIDPGAAARLPPAAAAVFSGGQCGLRLRN